MRTPSRALPATTTLLLTTALVLVAPAVAQAAPSPSGAPGDDHQHQTVDNRRGQIAPTARQRALAAATGVTVRWNRFGTPATLTPASQPLASGLAKDPVAAARAYVDANREVLGLTERGAAALDLLTSAPLGAGASRGCPHAW